MPSVNMRRLRDTKRLKAWLRAGKTIELCDRNKRIGRIVPENRRKAAGEWPDFEALVKEIIGDRVLPGADLLIQERGRY
jgi:antitoxin (DNA-binding transcriptional repressor) of toxin-antitoxin stability system